MGILLLICNIRRWKADMLSICNIGLGGRAMSSIDTVVRNPQDLARLVRARRRELGLTQDALAGVTGLDRAVLSVLERGERRMSLEVALRLVQALGMDIVIRGRGR
jgi:DNA-binding XRE family transcriptional regulator